MKARKRCDLQKPNPGFWDQPSKEIAGNDLWISRIHKADERACPSTAELSDESKPRAKQMVNRNAAATSGDVR
jgi:hypothetical protein